MLSQDLTRTPAAVWILTPKKDAEIWLAPKNDGTSGLRFSRQVEDYTAVCREHQTAAAAAGQKAAQAKKGKADA